jgi:hypothetical protein
MWNERNSSAEDMGTMGNMCLAEPSEENEQPALNKQCPLVRKERNTQHRTSNIE